MPPVRELFRKLISFSPPELKEQEVRVLTILLVVGGIGEWLGPGFDLLLYLLGASPQPFYPTSLWNIVSSLLMLLTAGLFQRISPRRAARFLVYSSLLLAPFAIHQLGGIFTPVPFFLLFPLLFSGFLFALGENILIFFLVLFIIIGLLLWERVHPPPPIAQDHTVYLGTYLIVGITAATVLAHILFHVYRRNLEENQKREQDLRQLYVLTQKQSQSLEQALSIRSQFLAAVSHELRTPLASIVGAAEIIYRKQKEITSEQIRIIHAAAVHTLRLVDNLLDLTRIETGELKPRFLPFNPRIMLDEIVSLCHSLTPPRCELKLFLENLPPRIVGDEEKIRRIVINLLSNALKATPEGIVTVRGWYEERAGKIFIHIQDTGSGFDPEALEKGEEKGLPGKRFGGEGMGLGLKISRKLVETLRGELVIQSRPGAGTQAFLSLPVSIEEPLLFGREVVLSGKPDVASAIRPRVLIVDDHPEILEIYRLHCEMCGCEAHIAASVSEGLKLLQEKGPFHLILLDLFMPEVNGYEGLRIYRQFLASRHLSTRIVALTAHVVGDDEKVLRSEGFDGFIPKPIGYEEFRRRIEESLGSSLA